MTRALIIADPQRDFCEGGSLGVAGGAAAVNRIDRLLKSDHGYAQVIASCDHHIDPGGHFAAEPDFVDSWPPHCVVGSAGAEFHDNLTYRDFAALLQGPLRARLLGLRGPHVDGERLSAWLRERKVDQIDVCGIATDYCVRATALDGVARASTLRCCWI